MITLTKTANSKITDRFRKDFLRLSLSGGGCNGYQYDWDIAEVPQDNDYVIDNRMVIDNHSMSFLQGSIIDWIDTVVQTGFEIHNPNEESACGCGVSVGF